MQEGVGARHPGNKPNTRSPPERERHELFGSGLATREVKRAVPSLEDQEVGMTEGVETTKMKSDVPNPGVRKAVPKPSYGKTSHSQSKKTEAYNLA